MITVIWNLIWRLPAPSHDISMAKLDKRTRSTDLVIFGRNLEWFSRANDANMALIFGTEKSNARLERKTKICPSVVFMLLLRRACVLGSIPRKNEEKNCRVSGR